jgi:hypothetical protein
MVHAYFDNTALPHVHRHTFSRRYLSALSSCFAASGKELVGFERYMALRKSGGNHCHLNALALPSAAGAKARLVFEKLAAQQGIKVDGMHACLYE